MEMELKKEMRQNQIHLKSTQRQKELEKTLRRDKVLLMNIGTLAKIPKLLTIELHKVLSNFQKKKR